jgi:hypothetical protein
MGRRDPLTALFFAQDRPTSEPLGTSSLQVPLEEKIAAMFRLGSALVLTVWLLSQGFAPAGAQTPTPPATILLPAGTKIELTLIRPLWAKTAGPGTLIYAQTTFPAISGDQVVIPPGTYVKGTLEKLTRPSWRSSRAQLEVLFRQLIFANGYVVELPSAPSGQTALIVVLVQVSSRSDLLLDNGAPIELTLAAPLELEARQVASAVPLSHPPGPGQLKSASRCVPVAGTPGAPGTPETVIPGSPGTPSTTIPGGPGMPDTVIPGTPPTPPTIIPGTPGTPGTAGVSCLRPIVLSSKPLNPPTNPPEAGSPRPAH